MALGGPVLKVTSPSPAQNELVRMVEGTNNKNPTGDLSPAPHFTRVSPQER